MEGSKKAYIILGIAIVILTAVLFGYFRYRSTKVSSQISQVQPTPPSAEELATWTDQAEFTFQYPKSLKLDPHEEDEENYAHVELTSSTNLGNLIVWVKDTTAETINAYVKQKKLTGGIDSSLGGEKAVKTITTDEPNKLTISSIRNGYLYQIEVNLEDKEYWQKIYDKVSFSFKYIESIAEQEETASDQTSMDQSNEYQSEGVEDLGEEVIE